MAGICWDQARRPAPRTSSYWRGLSPAQQIAHVQTVLRSTGLAPLVQCVGIDREVRVTVDAHSDITGPELLLAEEALRAVLDPTLYLEKRERPDRNLLRLRGVDAV